MSVPTGLIRVIAGLGLVGGGAWAQAATITVEASSVGNIVLSSTDTSTLGTQATPWTINETYNSHGHLRFGSDQRGGPLGDDNPTGSGHDFGKWISKTVTNNSGIVWTSFELELQVQLGTPSGQGDGLSFADGSGLETLFTSSVFSAYTRQDVARDYLNFSGGVVDVGQSVTFNFVVSDNSGNDPFYLLQTANKQDIPEPASLGLAALALCGVALARRRR